MELDPGTRNYGELHAGFVRWAYLPVFGEKSASGFGDSDWCNVDVNCEAGTGWEVVKKSVVWIIAGRETCTGVLINNTLQDSTPYVFTAAHCVFDELSHTYKNPVVYFNYETRWCGDTREPTPFSISGATLVATGDTLEYSRDGDSLDFALLRLNADPPDYYQPYYAGWDRSSTPPQSSTTIHHPRSDAKKISVDNDPLQISYDGNGAFREYVRNSLWWVVEWDLATTENGSSGGPLFNPGQRVIGTLTGGDANCSNSVNDFYTRFDYAWDYYPDPSRQLKHWLDPAGTDPLSLPGIPAWNVSTEPLPSPREEISIYPNPASVRLNLESALPRGRKTSLSVYSASGIRVIHRELIWEGRTGLDVERLQPGIYLLKLAQKDAGASGRFIIRR
jgi:hypothetical protein